jgi:hypothetical protein
MAIRKIFFLWPILISFCFLSSFSAAEERPFSINLWPLFQYTSDPIERTEEIEGLGPFFIWKKDPHQIQWGVRPLLYQTEDEKEPVWRFEFLYPFGKYQRKEGETKAYLSPLSLYSQEEGDGKGKWIFHFFTFFIGETEKGEDYWGFFPIYGNLLSRYGKDEVRFYLWPLYGETTTEGVHTTNLLWPIVSYTEGERKKGYRIFPVHGKKETPGVSQVAFWFWPIYSEGKFNMDTDDPVDEKIIFPLYLRRESRRFTSQTYLWPFYSYARDRLTGFEQLDLPWPFYRSIQGENLSEIRIFPLYGYRVKKGEMKRLSLLYLLYPLFQYEEDLMGGVNEKTYRILFLTRIRTGEDHQGVKKEKSIRVWPFFNYEREETGHEKFYFFYLFPFIDDGFERNLFPLFRIFRWEKDPRGGKTTNLFWGFYKRVEKEERDFWEVAHLIGVKKGNGWKKVSVLKGLVHYKREGENVDLRLFYLPLHLRWSHQQSGRLKSNDKEFADAWQENRNLGNRFVSSGEGPYQF